MNYNYRFGGRGGGETSLALGGNGGGGEDDDESFGVVDVPFKEAAPSTRTNDEVGVNWDDDEAVGGGESVDHELPDTKGGGGCRALIRGNGVFKVLRGGISGAGPVIGRLIINGGSDGGGDFDGGLPGPVGGSGNLNVAPNSEPPLFKLSPVNGLRGLADFVVSLVFGGNGGDISDDDACFGVLPSVVWRGGIGGPLEPVMLGGLEFVRVLVGSVADPDGDVVKISPRLELVTSPRYFGGWPLKIILH